MSRLYKIPDDIAKTHGEMEIPLTFGDIKLKPLPVAQILSYMAAVILGIFILVKTPVGSSGAGWSVFFVIVWGVLTMMLVSRSPVKQTGFLRLITAANYLPRPARSVSTNRKDAAGGYASLFPVKTLREDGVLEMTDGRAGKLYQVVGGASALLFSSDRDALIASARRFYAGLDPFYEVHFLTLRQSARPYRQTGAASRRIRSLEQAGADKELIQLAKTQKIQLTHIVADQMKATMQYALIIAPSLEYLRRLDDYLVRESLRGESACIRRADLLKPDDLASLLKEIAA